MRTLCVVPGCPALAVERGRCAAHRRLASGAWKRRRQEVLRRHGWRCAVCGERAVDVHHVVPASMGGSDEVGNLVALCDQHHREAHQAPQRR
jgi:5-methylcytosine-specific restriction endonuclease McrA